MLKVTVDPKFSTVLSLTSKSDFKLSYVSGVYVLDNLISPSETKARIVVATRFQ